jgi:hypothetical protein
LLTMSGGLTGGKRTTNFEFPVSSDYALPAAAQPAITETASLTAPAGVQVARTQQTNVVQIHHEAIQLSYHKMGNLGRLSGLNTQGQQNNAPDELAFQQARKLEKIARDIEFSFVQGTYNLAANAGQANTTRGLVEVCQIAGGTNVNGQAAQLDFALMQSLFLSMYNAGAPFSNVVLYVGGALKQRISAIYGFAPTDRNVGGVAIKQLETDFGNIGIVVSRFAPANTVLAVEMSQIAPVFLEVPGKGIMFYEELAKTGASEMGQMYGEVGLDYGAFYAHGRLFNVTA